MHSRIFEISVCPLDKKVRTTADEIPEWFVGSIADYGVNAPENSRSPDINWVMTYLGEAVERKEGEEAFFLKKNAREIFLKDSYERFIKHALELSTTTMDQFCGKECGVWNIRMNIATLENAFEDKYGFYVYDRQADELITINDWIRSADTGTKYYIGGIIDYHY